uniref:DUF834 domain-containing protein n=1 Tax=Oryza rufipogon TaxID=4529 RepID=A0A0E0PGX5_ORYRU
MASGKRQEGRGRPMGDGVVATGAGCAATQQPGNKAAHPRGRTACRRRAQGQGNGDGESRWLGLRAAGIAMAAWMASAEGAKAAAVVPARQASNGAVLGGDGGGLPQIRASWPDLEGGRRWWSATAADLRRLATAVGDGGDGGGHGS